jgi:hypothetical protein
MNIDNEDWIKFNSWDVRNPDHTLVTTLDQLCYGQPSVQRIQHWQSLTVWNAAPDSLKAEAEKYLKENTYA